VPIGGLVRTSDSSTKRPTALGRIADRRYMSGKPEVAEGALGGGHQRPED
jgi:hypothetical protein